MPVTTRPARQDDAAAIAAIYSQGIEDRIATFETEPRSAVDVEPWVAAMPTEPMIVAERDGRVIGWARLLTYSDRCCYEGVCEYTIYVAREARGAGAGRALLEGLLAIAEERGAWKVIGLLFTSNAPSIALAHKLGFRDVGVYEHHGQLEGEWRDVLLLERLLGDAAR
jgi:L-amino acid N-acyltransferase YncA